jgi:hypothetical protein
MIAESGDPTEEHPSEAREVVVDRDRRGVLVLGRRQQERDEEVAPVRDEREGEQHHHPGADHGSTTRRIVWRWEAPSTRAASSRAIGTPSMKFFASQIENGRFRRGHEDRDHRVAVDDTDVENIRYVGIISAMIGSRSRAG